MDPALTATDNFREKHIHESKHQSGRVNVRASLGYEHDGRAAKPDQSGKRVQCGLDRGGPT